MTRIFFRVFFKAIAQIALNTQLFKYQYSLLAFLAKNELNIKIFYKNYIFGNKNLFNGTFCHVFKTWSNVCFEV